jgi:hypothetical protein
MAAVSGVEGFGNALAKTGFLNVSQGGGDFCSIDGVSNVARPDNAD